MPRDEFLCFATAFERQGVPSSGKFVLMVVNFLREDWLHPLPHMTSFTCSYNFHIESSSLQVEIASTSADSTCPSDPTS
ncbi:hypothetical protein Y032_0059g2980 [Ancylostoma ceylanicum]|uniref:Uncharacterized protein n=1 Tax=Ancylostoma ceylanicum TaxID=53326 RepID=A0A016U3W4_9BILA|nr:hypothetical protein Y032_0059g2980 [Ancylostoma ceylanicum]